MSPETLKHWEDATPKDAQLPEHVKKGSDMSLMEDIYNAGVNKYLEKRASEDMEAMYSSQQQGAPRPLFAVSNKPEKLYDKYIRLKHKHDPHFSTALGGALGAMVGSSKGRATGILGGGAGALMGLSMAKNKDHHGG